MRKMVKKIMFLVLVMIAVSTKVKVFAYEYYKKIEGSEGCNNSNYESKFIQKVGENIVLCSQWQLSTPDDSNDLNTNNIIDDLSDSCRAGLAYIVNKAKDLDSTKCEAYDNFITFSKLVTTYLRRVCGNNSSEHPRADYYSDEDAKATDPEHPYGLNIGSNTGFITRTYQTAKYLRWLYDNMDNAETKSLYFTDLQGKKITSGNDIMVSLVGDYYEAKLKINYSFKKRDTLYSSIVEEYVDGNEKAKINCTVSGGATFGNQQQQENFYILNDKMSEEIILILPKNVSQDISLTCSYNKSFSSPKYYYASKSSNIQDIISTEIEKPKTINNKREIKLNSCPTSLNEINSTFAKGSAEYKKALVELYKKEQTRGRNYTNLLNFDNPSCGEATCKSQETSCMASSYNPSFSENDFSCYNNTVNVDGKVGYCLETFDLKPTSSYNPKPVYSGQLYFDVTKDKGNVLSGKVNEKCYFIDAVSTNNFSAQSSIKSVRLQKSNDSDSSNEDYLLKLNGDRNITLVSNDRMLFTGTKNITYSAPEVWADLSGKLLNGKCSDGNCKLLGYGIASPLNKQGIEQYKFIVNFKPEKSNESKDKEAICKYESVKQIIKDEKPQLEFRIIDTKNPFVDKSGKVRNTMTNWCYDENRENNELYNELEIKNVGVQSTIQTYYGNSLTSKNPIEWLKEKMKDYYGIDSNYNNKNINEIADFYKDGVINRLDGMTISRKISHMKGSNCSANNNIVKEIITGDNACNSLSCGNYNKPKYKITLTPQLMKDIIDKNNNSNDGLHLKYETFDLNCDENDICTSKLLDYLKSNGNLTINYSTKRKLNN